MSGDSKSLRFPCEGVSGGAGGYSDPWANVTKHKLLPNGTKEQIINFVAREPKTICSSPMHSIYRRQAFTHILTIS
jgi:hypothetical protein